MSRPPVRIVTDVPFHEVDDAFDWWMRLYDKNPDGQFFEIARQLKPYVTTEMFERHRAQFEHPKGESVVSIRFSGREPEGVCKKHGTPIAPGYCE